MVRDANDSSSPSKYDGCVFFRYVSMESRSRSTRDSCLSSSDAIAPSCAPRCGFAESDAIPLRPLRDKRKKRLMLRERTLRHQRRRRRAARIGGSFEAR